MPEGDRAAAGAAGEPVYDRPLTAEVWYPAAAGAKGSTSPGR
jgi:hypothetical protein